VAGVAKKREAFAPKKPLAACAYYRSREAVNAFTQVIQRLSAHISLYSTMTLRTQYKNRFDQTITTDCLHSPKTTVKWRLTKR
jgi:hypothetical protein